MVPVIVDVERSSEKELEGGFRDSTEAFNIVHYSVIEWAYKNIQKSYRD